MTKKQKIKMYEECIKEHKAEIKDLKKRQELILILLKEDMNNVRRLTKELKNDK